MFWYALICLLCVLNINVSFFCCIIFCASVFPTGIIKVSSYLTLWVHRWLKKKREKKKKERKEKPGCGDTPAHHMPHFCCGGQSMLSSAWVMSQVPQKSFTTILCVQKLWRMWHALPGTFSGSRWPGQMVWLKLPPLPLQQEIKHHS